MVKKDVSAIVSATGLIASVWTELIQLVKERGGANEDIHRLATPEGRPLLAKFADLIVDAGQTIGKVFTLKTGGSRTCEELVAAGRYDYAHPHVTSVNFPVQPSPEGTASVEFLEFDYAPTSDEVLVEAERLGLVRPAHEHALLFGEQCPEVQREWPIAFLHKPWLGMGGRPRVLCLWGDVDRRELFPFWFDGEWNSHFRFAFLRPSTSA